MGSLKDRKISSKESEVMRSHTRKVGIFALEPQNVEGP